MNSIASRLRRLVFGVSTDEVRFERRGLRIGNPELRARLEGFAETFLVGYHIALDTPYEDELAAGIAARVDPERCGFAFEGAGMALALLDAVLPFGRSRLDRFVAGAGAAHEYMIHIGAGWAIARLGGWQRRLARRRPIAQGLAADGLGFHDAFFKAGDTVRRSRLPRGLDSHVARNYDQGIGRCLWFVECGDALEIERTIAGFIAKRRSDLWSGVGLACTYAGGASRAVLEHLRDTAQREGHAAAMAQGSAFALLARARAGNLAPHNHAACEVLWAQPVDAVVALARRAGEALDNLRMGEHPYEVWRWRIQQQYTAAVKAIGSPEGMS